MMLDFLEKIWNRFSGEIDDFFFDRHLIKNLRTGFAISERLGIYLDAKGINHICGVFHDSWDGEPEVRVKVLLLDVTSFKECMKIWDELCEIGYKNLVPDDFRGIYISVDYPHTDVEQ